MKNSSSERLARVLRLEASAEPESIGPVEPEPASAPLTEADQWFDLGCELETRGSDLAAQAYERAISLDPRHADAHTNLGRLLHEKGRVVEAAAHYRRAVELAPLDPTAYFNLGVALQDLRQFRASAETYEVALQLDPELADAHANLALVREQLGDRSEAFRHYAEARRLSAG